MDQREIDRTAAASARVSFVLPVDRRPTHPRAEFATHTLRISAELTTDLRHQCDFEGGSPLVAFAGAWALVLGRWSGQEEISLGIPPRSRVRIGLAAQMSRKEFLQSVAYGMSHSDASDDIHSAIYHRRAGSSVVPEIGQNIDVVLAIGYDRAQTIAEITYNADLFWSDTIDRIAHQLHAVLREFVDNPQASLRGLPPLSAEERADVLYRFNDNARPFPRKAPVHELFEVHVTSTPDSLAIVSDQGDLTYRNLNTVANHLAQSLLCAGVQIGESIPILLPRSVQMVIAQLAVLKCGAVCVPIDVDTPLDRQSFVIKDCRARRILVGDNVATPAVDESIQRIFAREPVDYQQTHPDSSVNVRVSGHDPAYIMYTSGSTGTPKGVIVTHAGIACLIVNSGYMEISQKDCLTHMSNPSFDASTFEIWGALLHGARIWVVSKHVMLDAVRLASLIESQRVTIVWMTIGLFSQYCDVLARAFSTLRYLAIGGDVVEPHVVARLLRQGPPQHFLSAYGPTECTTFSTIYEIGHEDECLARIPIGRPIANTSIYILDGHMSPVPVGVVGDIYIGGPRVALGYLNRTDLTDERFLVDPFSADPEARLYKTGDLGRWRGDGQLEFFGRNDRQIKFRGFRIELGEIESRLIQHRAVLEAAVAVQDAGDGQKRLVAYVVGQNNAATTQIDVADVRAHLKSLLPEYMLPSSIVQLGRLPLTPSGKLDRRGLPMFKSSSSAGTVYQEPRTPLESRIAQIWQKHLGVERVGRDDDFFELGGHSLVGMEIMRRLADQSGRLEPFTLIMRYPTIARLAEYLGTNSNDSATAKFAYDVEVEEGSL